MSIEISHVSKTIGRQRILDDVSLRVEDGELVALLGPSGSGKTSLLRVIAGLEEPDSGQVVLEHKDATHSTPGERRVGFVFQHYALFRHMTVFENVAFGLRVKPRGERLPEAKIRERVQALLKLVQLEVLAERLPSQLSGGQRQRIALARALAVEPRFLLLDEPFGALDAQVRKDLRRWLRRLHDELRVTSVFVTHDQEEALEVADRVVVMNQGHIEQIGTPQEVYSNPANRFVFSFMGTVNLFQGRLDHGRAHVAGAVLDAPEHADASNVPAVALVRPHEIELHRHQEGGPEGEATVREVRTIGPLWRVVLDVPGAQAPIEVDLTAERGAELGLKAGDRVDVAPRRARIFREDRSPV